MTASAPNASSAPGRGAFVALEGGEGVGKSTQAKLLSEWLSSSGIDHELAREPGGTRAGEAIRDLVLNRARADIAPLTELFLILASRSEFVNRVARPVLDSGRALVADRFSLSTLAYQGYGRGIDLRTVATGLELATGGLDPDLYVVLDLPPERARRRRLAMGRAEDRIEGIGGDFPKLVREGYRTLARTRSNVVLVDGSGSIGEVHGEIVGLVKQLFDDQPWSRSSRERSDAFRSDE